MLNADLVDALMLPWLLDHDKVEIFKAGQERGLGFAFVATMEDILGMEQLVDREFFVELDHPVAGTLRYPGPPINPQGDVDAWVYRRAPLLGEHSREILGESLGYTPDNLDLLQGQGVI
jgi:crotonobetainyl-CoA:carnitine CoA-transferase CaiB-like acyl-CoA transferase